MRTKSMPPVKTSQRIIASIESVFLSYAIFLTRRLLLEKSRFHFSFSLCNSLKEKKKKKKKKEKRISTDEIRLQHVVTSSDKRKRVSGSFFVLSRFFCYAVCANFGLDLRSTVGKLESSRTHRMIVPSGVWKSEGALSTKGWIVSGSRGTCR